MRLGFAFLSAVLFPLLFAAQPARASDVMEWLNKANQAARNLNFTGTYFYHHGDHVEVLRVSHRVDRSGEKHKVEVLDGAHREFIRINDQVYCHLADGKTVRIDKNAVQRFFPAVVPDDTIRLTRFYIPKLGGGERVAGRECQVVILEPRDEFRYTQMIWIDRESKLPLKTRTVDEYGALVSMFVFSEIEIGRQPDKAVFDVRMAGKRMETTGVARDSASNAWQVTPPPGFQPVMETMRPLPGKKSRVLHTIYSDGLSSLSVFIEPIVEGVSYLEGLSTESATNIYARRVNGHKVTALGEVPAAALLLTANSAQNNR